MTRRPAPAGPTGLDSLVEAVRACTACTPHLPLGPRPVFQVHPAARILIAGQAPGRNDCWKANGQETWIAATWTVHTVRGCVDAQYRLRSAELQAVWRLLPPRMVAYACQDEAANEVMVNFFDTNPATLTLERGDRSTTLWRVGDATAGKYEGQNVSLVHQGDELALSRLDTNTGKTDDLNCKAK